MDNFTFLALYIWLMAHYFVVQFLFIGYYGNGVRQKANLSDFLTQVQNGL